MISHEPIHTLDENQRTVRLILRYGLAASIALLAIVAVHYWVHVSSESLRRSDSETLNLELGKTAITTEISNIQADLRILAHQAEARGYFDNLDSPTRALLARDFALFSTHRAIYDQIRLLDTDGNEIIRVNNQTGQAVIVEADRLQNKSGRYYFTESIRLEHDEIYVSPFDLNIEHGKIQTPLKPVIRVGTPVFDSSGDKIGVLILNYRGNLLLDRFRAATVNIAEHVMLLNHEGYWLSHHDRDREWGFMLDQEHTFASDFEREWQTISTTQSGQIETPNGLFSYTTIYPGVEMSGLDPELEGAHLKPEFFDRPWTLVSHVPREELNLLTTGFMQRNLPPYLVILLIFLIGSLAIARLRARQQMAEIEIQFEQYFRRVLESVELKVLAVDLDGSITFCNDALLDLLGWEREQLVGQNWLARLVADRDREACAEFFRQLVAREQEPSMHETWLADKDGNELLVKWHETYLTDSENNLVGLIFLGEDVTRVRDYEIRIRQLSRAVEQSPAAVVLTDNRGKIEYVNPKFERLTGYGLDEVKGLNPRILKSGETSREDYAELWRRIKRGKTWRGIFHNRKKSGELFWESASISGIRGPNGEITNFLAVKEDITEQRMLEERFQHCFNSAPVAMVMTDDEGRILLTNERLQKLYGYNGGDLLGQDIDLLIPPEAGYKRYLTNRKNDISGEKQCELPGGDFLAKKKSGEEFPVEIECSSAPSIEGHLNISTIVDLTARLALERELIQRNDEISRNQALNTVGRMANMIAHDLRNPLSAIKMGLQIFQKKSADISSENALELNQIALDQVKYMEAILADLMTFSRPDALNLEWVDISGELEQSINLLQQEIDQTGATINTWYEKNLPQVCIDSRKFRQVMTNLLANAMQSVEALDNVSPIVNLSIQRESQDQQSTLRITIQDNGHGIENAAVEELFEPFYTSRAKGTGLGLAIAKRFIEMQDGSLQLKAGEHGGCQAIVRLKLDSAQYG